jgi:anti-sigma factor (TIGR02949 family)
MISCAEAVRRLWEYLDGALDAADHDRVEEHLGLCRRCCGELEFAEELRRFLASSTHEDLPDDVMRRLNHTLEDLEP